MWLVAFSRVAKKPGGLYDLAAKMAKPATRFHLASMRTVFLTLAAAALLAGGQDAGAQTLTIGVSAPLSGPSALLGRQVVAGATIAAKAWGVEVRIADDACTAEGGASVARQFVADKVGAVVGFLCTEALEAALPVLKDAGIAAITVGVRTEWLTDRRQKTGWPLFRLAPRGDDERNAAASILTRLWRDQPFAIVDDGTIYGRELAETVRNAAEQAALKPVFTDTYRPDMNNQIGLAGRLKKAGAASVFVGGDGGDVAILGRDAAALDASLTIAGGEALRTAPGDVPYAEGTLMIALPEWADIADAKALTDFSAASVLPEGYALPTYAAVELARAAAERAAAADTQVADVLAGGDFQTAIGPVRFDAKGDLTNNPYRLFRFENGAFVHVQAEGQ
jgi:branched-chain amino acid transport system substrate-binding protein